MVNGALFSSNSDEWATPAKTFNELDKEFNFTLDACATEENHKCEKYFTKAEDGLKQSWGGIKCFVTRLIVKYQTGLKRLITRALSLILL